MFEALPMVTIVHASEDAEPRSVLVTKIKFTAQQNFINTPVVVKVLKKSLLT